MGFCRVLGMDVVVNALIRAVLLLSCELWLLVGGECHCCMSSECLALW